MSAGCQVCLPLSHLTDAAELVQFVLDVLLGRPLSLQIQVGWQTDLHGWGRGGLTLSLGGHTRLWKTKMLKS